MKKLFIITGELSGDIHAKEVVKYIKQSHSDIEIEAIGGESLKQEGIKLFKDHSKMQGAGFSFKMFFDHLFLAKNLIDYLTNSFKPDLILLIDYGGFNLNISKVLKKKGFKIFYYIPPQIWASRKYRINTVKKNIDLIMSIFPFETKMYKENNINVEFVSHPLISQLPDKVCKEDFIEKYELDKTKKIVGIFPGSRVFEVKYLLPIFLKASKLIKKQFKDIQFVIAQAPNLKESLLKEIIKNDDIKVIKNANHALLSCADSLILASGTVALEAALYNTPMLISYKAPWLWYIIYLFVRNIDMVSLPNIISEKYIVKELIQHNATPKKIAEETLSILENNSKRIEMIENLKNVRNLLGEKISSQEVAENILKNI